VILNVFDMKINVKRTEVMMIERKKQSVRISLENTELKQKCQSSNIWEQLSQKMGD
jgi:hypothetical protein